MPWFAARAIMYFKWKDAPQSYFNVWENVLLIEAPDAQAAHQKAEELAREEEGDVDSSLTDDGHPATQVFAGIRVVQTVFHRGERDEPSDGDEISYAVLRLPSMAAVEALAGGGSVELTVEPIRFPEQSPEAD